MINLDNKQKYRKERKRILRAYSDARRSTMMVYYKSKVYDFPNHRYAVNIVREHPKLLVRVDDKETGKKYEITRSQGDVGYTVDRTK